MNIKNNLIGRAAVLFATLFLSTSIHAGMLDFTEVGNGFQGGTQITLTDATITSFGDDLFVYHPGDFGIPLGGFCGINGGSCEAGAEVAFNSAVADLTLEVLGFNVGDVALVEIFNGATLLSSVNVLNNMTIDFTGISGITSLLITDSSTGAGFSYHGFSFNEVAAVSEPSTLALLGLGILCVGFARRKSV